MNLIKLEWNSPNIFDEIGDGLWNNNGKISIHIPIFKNKFKFKFYKNYNDFYLKYDENDIKIEIMSYYYNSLNDILFNNKCWEGNKKAIIYTTIEIN